VWVGTVGDCFVGPHVLSHRLTGNPCRDFPLHYPPKLLEDVQLVAEHGCGTCMMVFRAVRDVLSNTSHDRWIDTGGPTAWPPRSTPDLNPPDFYLWRHLNTLVYAAPVDNEVTLHHRIVDACQTIRSYPGIFERMWQSLMRRVEACIESHAGQVYSFSYNSQIKRFRAHAGMNIFCCFVIWDSCPEFVRTFQLHSVYSVLNQDSKSSRLPS
jgi:hypothetical protein